MATSPARWQKNCRTHLATRKVRPAVPFSQRLKLQQVRQSQTFVAQPLSTRDARRFVAAWLEQQELAPYVPRVSLATSELSANAVLHTSQPFTVSVQNAPSGVRVEVVDSAPHLVPMRIPLKGTAADLTWLSETGRGLQIVSAVANRWGITLAQNVKTVWAEFDLDEPPAPTEATLEDERPPTPKGLTSFHLHFEGLPVRAAIASGLDVEEAIRDLHAQGGVLDLVDRTASLRLAGRHAALDASSRDQLRFDLDLDATDEEMAALAKLNLALAERGGHGPSPEVARFRHWLSEETRRQRDGLAPSPFPDEGAAANDEWLWDQAGAGYAALSADGTVLRINDTLRDLVGGEVPHELVGELLDRVLADGRIENHTARVRRGDGSLVTTRISAVVVRGPDDDEQIHVIVHAPQSQNADELIRALQQTLIPPAPPIVPGLDVAAVYHPAQGEVGGDFYDVFEVAEGDWCAVLGDVSGKGIEAAIVTSTARHAVRSSALREPVPSGLMTALNRALLEKGSTRFCTVALLRVQHLNGAWVATLTSGGHPYPLLVRHGTATRLGHPGSLLGMFEDVSFHDVSIKLAVGDALVLYTDGVTEARNGAGEFFGEERMHEAISHAGSSAQAIVDAVLARVLEFQEGPSDDIALVVIRRPSL